MVEKYYKILFDKNVQTLHLITLIYTMIILTSYRVSDSIKTIIFDYFDIKEISTPLSLIVSLGLISLLSIAFIYLIDIDKKYYNNMKNAINLLLEYDEIDYVYNGTKLVFYERKNDNADGYTYLTFDMNISYYSPTRLTDNGVSAILNGYSELIKKNN